jgi:hypothetical protein
VTLRIVTDLHHSVLYESLAILFVDRAILGPAELLVWMDGHYVTQSGPQTEEFGRTPYAVPSEWIKDSLSADIVISTVGGTREPMRSLAESVGALYVDHIGNAWDQPIGPNILWAVKNGGTSGVTYHPEFHRVPWVPPTGNRIGSFHASFAHSPCRKWWDEAQAAHPEYEWRIYGTIEDQLRPHQVAQARSDCIAIWHCKDADGYGFGVHEAFASGRTVIGHASHYTGKIAEPLFSKAGLTYLEPDMWAAPLEQVGFHGMARFEQLVDFDAEADMVRDYLEARL